MRERARESALTIPLNSMHINYSIACSDKTAMHRNIYESRHNPQQMQNTYIVNTTHIMETIDLSQTKTFGEHQMR